MTSDLNPRGVVSLPDETWSATAAGRARVAAGTPVRVTAADGLTLTVEPAADNDGSYEPDARRA